MDKEIVPFTFARGIQREFDAALEPDSARRLINFEPVPTGGLIPRRRWQPGSVTSSPDIRKVRAIHALPVHAGYETPIRRQRDKRMKAGLAVTEIGGEWFQETQEKSLLVVVLSYSEKDVGTSTITVTTPTGWVSAGVVHSNDAPTTLSQRIYYIEGAATREGTELFEFSAPVRRAVIEMSEWRGVKFADALDVYDLGNGFDVRPDTDLSAATDTDFPRQLVIGAISAVTNDASIQTSDFPPGYYDFRDPNGDPRVSVGKNDYWLNTTVGRQVITESNVQRFYANLDATEDEDDAKSRWVAQLVTFKAKERRQNNKDYYVIDNANDADTHGIHAIDLDDIEAGSWETVGTIETVTTDEPVSFAAGFSGILISSPHFVPPQQTRIGMYFWDSTSLIRINRSPPARVVAFGDNRFHACSTKDHPARWYWSRPGDPTTWNENAWLDVGDTSERIFDMAFVNEGKLFAKRDALYYITGSGPLTGTPQKLAHGTGMPGRCICPVPGGAIVFARDHIWSWGGGKPEILSRQLDTWWKGRDLDYVTTAYVNGKVYAQGGDEDTCVVYDLSTGAWWVDRPPFLVGALYSWDHRDLVAGPYDDAAVPLLNFQRHPTGTRARDDFAVTQNFHAQTPEIMLGSASRPSTPKSIYLAYQQTNTRSGERPLKVTPIYNGVRQKPRELPMKPEDGDYRERLDVGVHRQTAVHKCQFEFDRTLSADDTTMIHLEYIELVYDLENPR